MKRAVALIAFVAFALPASPASGAEFGIVPGSLTVRTLDAEGNPEGRSGSHPDRMQIDFELEAGETSAREFAFELPPGLGGNLDAVPKCPRELVDKGEECPADTQVGTITLGFSEAEGSPQPIFQLEPAPGEAAAFGSTPGLEIPLEMELRPSDYGITLGAHDLPQVPLTEGHIELWGVPADHQEGTTIPRRPFLTLPTRCGPLVVNLHIRSWEAGAPWLSASAEAGTPLSGCENLAFEPRLEFQLSDPAADSPTGARIGVTMDESGDPDGLANAQLRNATIEFPDGLVLSPGGAAGLTLCSDAQFGLGMATEALCPPTSRIGGVELESPSLPERLVGEVYIGEERPGERFRLLIALPAPGTVIKFASAMQPGGGTGRLSAVLRDLPQVPLSELVLSVDGGPNALLASPLTCGSFVSTASFESYGGGAPAASSSSTTVGVGPGGSPCSAPAAFSPSLILGSSRHLAGRQTAFSMTLQRRAGEQLIRRFSVSLPRGLNVSLGRVERCPDPAATTGSCPAGSKIGDAAAEVGAGASPIAFHGSVYAGDAYRGAPFSMVIALDAAIGPFDLGTMVVRGPVRLTPRGGRVATVSDPLPEFIEGIPIRVQAVRLALNRPGVVRNPTSCKPANATATFEAPSGASASATSPLAVKGCRRLGFRPAFSVALVGRSEMRRDGKPGLRISARFRPGDANLRGLRLSLPRPLRFDISGLSELCSRHDAVEGLCSPRARVGSAYARTSLLSRPLRGPIYVVQPKDDGMPDLWLGLSATGSRLEASGRTLVRNGRIVTALGGMPDTPLSAFSMRLWSGSHGTLSLLSDPCRDPGRLGSGLAIEGQNGARHRLRLRAKAPCG